MRSPEPARRTVPGAGAMLAAPMLAALLLSAPLHAEPQRAGVLPQVELFMPAACAPCAEWGRHIEKNGFAVAYREVPNMKRVKNWLNVPGGLESQHSARVGTYFIEGPVPAADIKTLLAEKPQARGLAVATPESGHAPGKTVLVLHNARTQDWGRR